MKKALLLLVILAMPLIGYYIMGWSYDISGYGYHDGSRFGLVFGLSGVICLAYDKMSQLCDGRRTKA